VTTSSSDAKPGQRLHERIAQRDAEMADASPASQSSFMRRFVPREEIDDFAAWTPGSFGAQAQRNAPPPPPAAPTHEQINAQLQLARQGGYADGYRDGLAALESFKQSCAAQVTSQVAALVSSLQGQLQLVEQGAARHVADIALALARQVVRHEIATQPALVAAVAQEALAAAMASARQVTLRLHPDDHALVAAQAGDALAQRGARLASDVLIARGGCVVETEIGVVDASLASRWRRAAATFGRGDEWTDEGEVSA